MNIKGTKWIIVVLGCEFAMPLMVLIIGSSNISNVQSESLVHGCHDPLQYIKEQTRESDTQKREEKNLLKVK